MFFQFGAAHAPILNSPILLRSESAGLIPLLLDRTMTQSCLASKRLRFSVLKRNHYDGARVTGRSYPRSLLSNQDPSLYFPQETS